MRCEVWDGEVGALTARLSAWCHVRRGGTLSTGIRVSRGAKAVKRKRAGELNSLSSDSSRGQCSCSAVYQKRERARCEKNSADGDARTSFTLKYGFYLLLRGLSLR